MKRIFVAQLFVAASLFAQTPKTVINNGSLASDFDLKNFRLLNWSNSQTFPPINPPAGSIVDSMVSASAGIQQSKLSLNGVIPPGWLGTSSTTAAVGNDSRLSDLRTANALKTATAIPIGTGADPSNGQVLTFNGTAWVPSSTAGTGTVTSFSAGTLSPLFTTSVATSTTTPALSFVLSNAAGTSWFGNASGSSGAPSYNTATLPVALIPPLPASQITSGSFSVNQLPSSIQRLVAASASLSGSAPSINWSTTTSFYWTISANSTPTFTGQADPWSIVVAITNTGAFTVTWPGSVKWITGSQPPQTTGAHTDLWGFQDVNGTIYGAQLANY